jgi:hypothetical protein
MQSVGDNGTVEWNESFDHVCFLTILKGNAFHQWDVGFEVNNVSARYSPHGFCKTIFSLALWNRYLGSVLYYMPTIIFCRWQNACFF